MVDATFEAAFDSRARAANLRYAGWRIGVYAFLAFFALIYLLPLFVIVANSFRDLPEIAQNGLMRSHAAFR
jgi:glucose/mannose transport system permease protein